MACSWPSPVGHGTGYGFGIRLAIYLGRTLSLLASWDARKAAQVLSEHGAAYTHGATPFAQDLLDVDGIRTDYDLSRLRYFVSGGATIPWHVDASTRDPRLPVD